MLLFIRQSYHCEGFWTNNSTSQLSDYEFLNIAPQKRFKLGGGGWGVDWKKISTLHAELTEG